MSSLFQSLKDKAQSAVNSSGLADHIPGGRTSPSGGQSSGGGLAGITKSHTFESIHHQLRTFQQQYSSSTTPVQKIVTSAKGVAIDYDTVSRDAEAHSKELYLWGQTEQDDIKDVTDRLGWLNYVHGSLAGQLGSKIDTARSPFKALRDAENALAPKRNMRTGLQNQIQRIEYDQRKDGQQKMRDLKVQLQKVEEDTEEAEREIDILKRRAIRESEQMKWEAVREYAEKLSMVAQAALSIVPVLPPTPPSKVQPYGGAQTTASVRASLQKAMDNYTPGNVTLIVGGLTASDLKHTRSFGETHAQELSRIGSSDQSTSNIPMTPPLSGSTAPSYPSSSPSFPQPVTSPSSLSKPVPMPSPQPHNNSPPSAATAPSPMNMSPPLNPANLNQAPAQIPTYNHPTSPVFAPNPADPSTKVLSVTPTVAETGVPQTAGPGGPGPSSGSLLDKKPSPPGTSSIASLPRPKWESAEEEKKRLEREERERVLGQGSNTSAGGPPPKWESAEEEKKRLEREERERVLKQGGSGGNPPPHHDDDPEHDGELPPYQEF